MSSDGMWHVLRAGCRFDPMTPIELAFFAKSGRLKSTDQIWRAGLPGWIEAGSVEGLVPSQPVRAATAPPAAQAPASRPAAAEAPSMLSMYRARLSGSPSPSLEAGAEVSLGRESSTQHPASVPPKEAKGRAVWPAEAEGWTKGLRAETGDGGSPGVPATLGAHARTLPVASVEPTCIANSAEPVGFSLSGLLGGNFSEVAADAVIMALDKYDIRTIDDLANDERLKLVAIHACDYFPWTLRVIIARTIGRLAFEDYMFDFLAMARGRIPHQHRAIDLHAAIRELARSPWLSERFRALYERSRSGVSSIVAGYMPQGGLATVREWGARISGPVALPHAPSPLALSGPSHGPVG